MSQQSQCRRDRIFWSLFPHLCLVTCLVLYTIAGAPLFQALEDRNQNNQSEVDVLLVQLWNFSQRDPDEESFVARSRPLLASHVKSGGNWTFLGSLFFCCTVVTSVGYGNLVPVTVFGRIACMLYAAFGIPLMLLVLADLGGVLAGFLSRSYESLLDVFDGFSKRRSEVPDEFPTFPRGSAESSTPSTMESRVSIKEPLNLTEVLKSQAPVKRRVMQMRNIDIFELIIVQENRSELPPKSPWKRCHSCPDLDLKPSSQSVYFNFDNLGEEVDQLDVPVLLIVCIVVAYLMLGAFILPLWEDWDRLEAFYFCFVTLTTIGFGDVFPAHPNYFLLLSLYTVVGMAIMCMAFKLMQNRMVCMYKQCVICLSRGNVQMTTAEDQS